MGRLGIPCELLVHDDGSTDETASILEHLASEIPELTLRRHENRGHGPTILAGYREATAPWVLQVDGDDEMGPAAFEGFWRVREQADLIVGRRVGRHAATTRRLLTRASTLAIRFLFGGGPSDANCPYRLMRRSVLGELVAALPAGTFAPNVIVSGLAARRGFRIIEQDVECRTNAGDRRANWNIARAALLSSVQALAAAYRARSRQV